MHTVRLALRDWDWLTPLLLHEVPTPALDALEARLVIDRVGTLIDPWQDGPGPYAGFEISLARLNRAVLTGDHRVVALPHPLMQSFRQRCLIVARDSPFQTPQDLRGGRIGVTGWIDSGNTWTRAVLADAGVPISAARWVAGRLTAAHPEQDRLDGHGRPGWIEAAPAGSWMTALLSAGELDAVCTPFMPPGFFAPDAPWRPLYADVRAAELDYADRWGLVPVHHLLGFAADGFDPDLAAAVSRALAESRRIWRERRRRYAETSMWLAADLLTEAERLPPDWDAPEFGAQRAGIAEFTRQQRDQGITDRVADPEELFATAIDHRLLEGTS
ncbi:substrate-binding domain-containing protein [Enemella evansiae]|uniref:nitrate ABC transporter substrate-binding protein n=1 Tax=Enemella evansiae TaxID=2016499 RepID=UPI0010610D64|nr:nitrate ABC transporter substrate-binding protein [Enemella evansiae]TDO93378.1 4,5-dihydroxyphthalate decarboxylase [Enemella evansiae]